MKENKIHLDFVTQSVQDWEKIAQQELNNKDPWQNLTKEISGLRIKPYYDRHDDHFHKKIKSKSGNGVISCDNVPKVLVINAKEANKEALHHLNTGADGVYFAIQSRSTELNVLLKNIELPHCSVFFRCEDDDTSFLSAFADFAEEKKEKVNGGFFGKGALAENLAFPKFKDFKNFRFASIQLEEKENIVDEIVDALCTAVEFLDRLIKNDFNKEQAFQFIGFSISVTSDFFLSIAKIRALKNLWLTLQEAYQIKNPIPSFIHGSSSVWLNENFEPHSNLLKQTTAGMAAVIAGCNALTIEPEDLKNPMMSRIARNVTSILKEESHLSKVMDPLTGSFYVESLTNQIASKAWTKFQQTL